MLRKIIPLLIAFLLFTIPIAGASSFIEITESHGEDNVEGYIKSFDTYTGVVRVDSTTQADSSDLNNIIFDAKEGKSTLSFSDITVDECNVVQEGGNPVNYCTFSDNVEGVTNGVYEYEARLIVGSGSDRQLYKTDVNITVDDIAPALEAGTYEFDYLDRNIIIKANFSDEHSGIRNIIVSVAPNGTENWIKKFEGNYGGEESVFLDESIYYQPPEKGYYNVKTLCSDGLSHDPQTEIIETVYMDFDAPEIVDCKFGRGGNYYSVGDGDVEIICDVKDDSPNLEMKLENIPGKEGEEQYGICECQDGDKCKDMILKNYTCSWKGEVKLVEQQTYNLDITINDDSGNSNKRTLNIDLSVDDEPPIFKDKFYSQGESTVLIENGQYETINYVKKGDGNTLYALFNDSRSGVASATIQDVSGSTSITSTRCERSDTNYLCVWENINFDDNTEYYISEVVDNVGNSIGPEDTTRNFVIDDTSPQIVRDADIYSETGLEVVGQGEKMRVVVVANDTGSGVWKIELPDFEESFEDVCVMDGENSRCSFTTKGSFVESGYNDLNFIVYDKVGNSVEDSVRVDVVERDSSSIDVWELDNVDITPSEGLDKKIVGQYPQRVLAKINLYKKIGGYDVSSVELRRCSGDISYFIAQPSVFRSDNSASLLFETNPTSFSSSELPDNLNITCDIRVYSASRTKVFSQPEDLSVNFEIPINKFVAHEELVGVDDKINDLESQIKDFKWLGTLKEWIEYARFACSVRNTLKKVSIALQVLQSLFDGLKYIPYTYPGAVSACMSVSSAEKGMVDEFILLLDKPCKFVSCEYGALETFEGVSDFFGFSKSDTIKQLQNKIGGDSWLKRRGEGIQKNSEVFSENVEEAKIWGKTGAYAKAAGMNFQTDPYSNVYMALAKFCLPALAWNAEKLRQIYCQELYCLKNDVKENIATPATCSSIRTYSLCKYFLGPAAMLLLGPLEGLIDLMKDIVTDYAGIINWVFKILQNSICSGSTCNAPGAYSVCRLTFVVYSTFDITNDIMGLMNQWKALQGEDICEVALKD